MGKEVLTFVDIAIKKKILPKKPHFFKECRY